MDISQVKKFIFYVSFLLASYASFADTLPIKPKVITDLSVVKIDHDEWKFINALPKSEHLIVTTKLGKIFSVTQGVVSSTPVLNIAKQLSENKFIELTAITSTPNFNLPKHNDYLTLYSAHVEESSTTNKRLLSHQQAIDFPFDAVIIAWKLQRNINHELIFSEHREVIRIPINKVNQAIKQLSFNPYISHWHENYGHLFIALAKQEQPTQALYAGAILRIHPQKFALQNYSVPDDNPFIRDTEISDEIALVTNENILSFTWQKKKPERLLIHSQTNSSQQIYSSLQGSDRRKSNNESHLWQASPTREQSWLFSYHGRGLTHQWGNILLLNSTHNHWQFNIISSSATPNKPAKTQNLHLQHQAIKPAQFIGHEQANGEIILLDTANQLVLSLANESHAKNLESQPSFDDTAKSNSYLFIIFSGGLLLFLIICFIYIRTLKHKSDYSLRHEWANFDINTEQETLLLYKPHQKVGEFTLPFKQIIKSELILNEKIINCINTLSECRYSEESEKVIQRMFSQEYRFKMVDNRTRKIQLRLTDKSGECYLFCLYLRVGNIRLTKVKYKAVIKKIFHWNRFISTWQGQQ